MDLSLPARLEATDHELNSLCDLTKEPEGGPTVKSATEYGCTVKDGVTALNLGDFEGSLLLLT